VKALAREERLATPEEQAVLVKYVGWGGLKSVFDEGNTDYAKERAELKELLTPEEYAAARRSVLDAHYTSADVVNGIYSALERMGFSGGRVLEPAMGTGNFFGLMPAGVAANSQLIGVELDTITGAIAKQLYQRADIKAPRGFQEVNVPAGYFDVAIGNPPFGAQTLPDESGLDLPTMSIHNFFFAKSVHALRPGGLLAMVVSHYFLDARTSQARAWIAKRAEFVGAIRLPNTAFAKNANTEVTTDIVFLRKLGPDEKPVKDAPWVKVGEVKDAESGEAIPLNRYFIENPDMMLGTMTLGGTMYAGKNEATLEAPKGQDLAAELAKAVAALPQAIYQPAERTIEDLTSTDVIVPDTVKVGGFFVLPDSRIARRTPDVMDKPQHAIYEIPNEKAGARIRGMIRVRDALRALMRAELNDASDVQLRFLRSELNRVYDGFVAKHGYLNSIANRRAFQEDPDIPLLESLEPDYDPGVSKDVAKRTEQKPRDPSAKKAVIFTKRVLSPASVITKADSAQDALAASLSMRGHVDLAYMAQLYGNSEDDIRAELKGVIYDDPKMGPVTADLYLSGNVKKKLAEAREAAKSDPKFRVNVEALEKVQPADVPAVDIDVRLGTPWVPASDMADFVESLLEVRPDSISYQPSVAKWVMRMGTRDTTPFTSTWGARTDARESWYANQIIEATMNSTPIVIRRNIGTSAEPHYIVLEQETDAARAKGEQIAAKFKEWVFADQTRRERLARLYNDKYNTDILWEPDGSHLTLPGTNPAIQLTPNKKHSVWRMIQNRNTLLDHVVGSGKTFTIAAAVMEKRRLGISRKPMIVVPNHLVRQWRDEWYALYPNANILATTKDDFKKENRQRLFAKIATGDWDAVIVAHSAFSKIAMPRDELLYILNEQITAISSAIEQLKKEGGEGYTVRQLEQMKERLKDKQKRNLDKHRVKDSFIDFSEMGVDDLSVDEAHEFKNLAYYSGLRNVTGLGNPEGSGKAFDLFVKTRYLQKKNGRVTFATGTPVSNSLVEMFTMQRYLDHDGLVDRGIVYLDSWAGVHGDIANVWEVHPSGNGYRLATRFAQFVNLAELITQYRKFAEVITQQDMIDMAAKAGKKYPIPKVAGGRPKLHVAPRSSLQANFFGLPEFVRDGQGNIAFEQKKNEKGEALYADEKKTKPLYDPDKPRLQYNKDSILWKYENLKELMRSSNGKINALSITNEARKAGLDYRLIDAGAEDYKGSKINVAIGEILRIYKKWEADKGTQLVFCDLSTPKGAAPAAPITEVENGAEVVVNMDELLADSSGFSVYDDIKAKLIAQGIPEREIAFIHDAKTDIQKQKLFARVNRGEVRVLLGSTFKMGAGTNVQKRLVGLHHLDAPWRPSDLEQREGRIVRQGNELYQRDPDGFEVEIHRYATEKTYDTRMWQIIQHKAAGIEQLRKGQLGMRRMEDIAGEAANAADMKAAASGNPLIAEEIKLRDRVKKLGNLQDAWRRGRYDLERRVGLLKAAPERMEAWRAETRKLIAARLPKPEKDATIMTGPTGEAIKDGQGITREVAGAMKAAKEKNRIQDVGTYRGFAVRVDHNDFFERMNIRLGVPGTKSDPRQGWGEVASDYGRDDQFSASGFLTRLDNWIDALEKRIEDANQQEARAAKDLAKAEVELAKPFDQAAEFEETRERHRKVQAELLKQGGSVEMSDEMRAEWKAARKKMGAQDDEQPSGDTALSRAGAIDTPAFRRWFGESKVVDEQGRPRVVYHGTADDFSVFDGYEIAGWFSEQPGLAEMHAKSNAYGGDQVSAPAIMPVYLSIQNPLDLTKHPTFDMDDGDVSAREVYRVAGMDLPDGMTEDDADYSKNVAWEIVNRKAFEDAAVANGYDGIKVRQNGVVTWAAFKREQIKSASGNHGTFDPASQDIRLSRSGAGGMALADANAVANTFRDRLKGLPPLHVLETVSQAPEALRRDIRALGGERDTAGAWHNGEIYLFASNLRSPEHAAWVILHEATHHGLRGMWGRTLDPLLMQIYLNNGKVRQLAERQRIHNPKLSVVAATEEALANMGGDNIPQTVWERIVAFVRRVIRQLGFKLRLSDNDVRELVASALRFVTKKPDRTAILSGTALLSAWHGTPHDFDEFSLDKIGSGEGAQAFGWGLYFTGRREIAEHYRRNLSSAHIARDFRRALPDDAEFDEVMGLVGTGHFTPYQERVLRALQAEDWLGFDYPAQAVSAAYRELDSFDPSQELRDAINDSGRLFKVELAPAEDEYLDWDKSLSRQSEKVKAALNKLFDSGELEASSVSTIRKFDSPGSVIYKMIASDLKGAGQEMMAYPGAREASKRLHALGIPGIRYLDQGSRGDVVVRRIYGPGGGFAVLQGTTSHGVFKTEDEARARADEVEKGRAFNYVIFDDRLVKVEAKLSRNDQTETPEFKRWFGDSKVVDEQGRPLVAYHGTTKDFTEFKIPNSPRSGHPSARLGAWFSAPSLHRGNYDDGNAEFVAESFTESGSGERLSGSGEYRDGANVRPVYLRIKNPKEYESFEDLFDAVDSARRNRNLNPEQFRESLFERGFDGIVVRNSMTDGNVDRDDWVAFRPEQIKSAIGNRGTFSPTNPDTALSRTTAMPRGRGTLDHPEVRSGYRAWAGKVVGTIDNWLEPIGRLPEKDEYLTERYKALGRIAKADEMAKFIRKAFVGATDADRQAVYDYLVTAGAEPTAIADATIRANAETVKAQIRQVGDKLVEYGLLSPEAHEQYRDGYLPRLYLKHLLGEADFKRLGGGKKVSDMGYLKARKDIPEDVRKVILGEITDPGFLGATAVAKPLRDMVLLDWLTSISQKEDWILKGVLVPWGEVNLLKPAATPDMFGGGTRPRLVSAYWLRDEAARIRKQAQYYDAPTAARARELATAMERKATEALEGLDVDHKQFKQIPDTARYGRMRGIWVRAEIYDDLMGVNDFIPTDPGFFQNLLGYGGVGTKVTQLWKTGKVALNPPSQIRNFVSNGVLLQLSGVALPMVPVRVMQAWREIATDGPHWKVAKKYGVTESTFSAQELYRAKRDLLDLERDMGKLSPLGKLHRMAAVVMDMGGDLYQKMEALFKTAKIIDEMAKGRGESKAALEAQKWLFDYSLVAKEVRYLRNAPIGVPFLTFQVKVLPRMAEVALTAPWRFLPWVGLLYGMSYALAAAYDVDDDDLEKLKKALPEWLVDRGHTMLLPWKDEQGRWQVLDLGYYFPWTAWVELARELAAGEPGKAVKTAGIFSGPVTDLLVAIKTGRDSFTGREIYKPGDPPARQAMAIMNYLWTMAAPPFVTSMGFAGHAWRAATGETNRHGDTLSSPSQAALRLFGVNLYAMEPEQTRAANIRRQQFEIDEVKKAARARLVDRSLTPEKREAIVEEYRGEAERRQRKLADYIKESGIHPNLQTGR
jgi:N12 class adenine-specific DNA methylase/predicted RNA methylase